MYRILPGLMLIGLLFSSCGPSANAQKAADAAANGSSPSSSGELVAFPGAEGYGAHSVGGRGGRVIFVDNLNDSGSGSLRAAVEAQGPRIVIFRVSGTIRLKKALIIENPYITIAGQTAPGDGICLRDYPLQIFGPAHDVIIRGLRSRHGDETDNPGGGADALGTNGPSKRKMVKRVIIDHCSFSWSADETVQIFGFTSEITLQWSFLTEGLDESFHTKGQPHSFALLLQTSNHEGGISVHHNLLAHHRARNPKFSAKKKFPEWPGYADVRNNVVYNWRTRPAHIASQGPVNNWKINMVGNYYKYGPDTPKRKRRELLFVEGDGGGFHFYLNDNILHGFSAQSADNWTAVSFADRGRHPTDLTVEDIRVDEPFEVAPVYTESAEAAYEKVLQYAGCISPMRDAIDSRVVREVKEGKGKHIDSQRDIGGYISYKSTQAPVDSDEDGMPDAWESQHGLNPNDASDGNGDRNGDGYTNIEEYINSLIPMDYVGG